jgi:Fur family ferric uptake transcriptional regulator
LTGLGSQEYNVNANHLQKDGEMTLAAVDEVDDKALEVLRAEGKRITRQRGLLLRVIREGKGHLDADEIYRLVREKDPRISLSTVYRNLNLLKELGLISELHLDQEHHHYELRDETEHYHLICSSCDRIMEFHSPLVRELKSQIGGERDFLIERVHIDLVGRCAKCRSERD